MIVPNKHLNIERSLIGTGSIILEKHNKPSTVSFLWERIKHVKGVRTFEQFILSLDLLFILGLIGFEKNLLIKVNRK